MANLLRSMEKKRMEQLRWGYLSFTYTENGNKTKIENYRTELKTSWDFLRQNFEEKIAGLLDTHLSTFEKIKKNTQAHLRTNHRLLLQDAIYGSHYLTKYYTPENFKTLCDESVGIQICLFETNEILQLAPLDCVLLVMDYVYIYLKLLNKHHNCNFHLPRYYSTKKKLEEDMDFIKTNGLEILQQKINLLEWDIKNFLVHLSASFGSYKKPPGAEENYSHLKEYMFSMEFFLHKMAVFCRSIKENHPNI